MEADDPPIGPDDRGHEHASYIIEALETGRTYRGHFNVRNDGCIPNLPDDAIVEVPGYVDRLGVHIPRVGPLPLACAATCNASIEVQRMSVKAAVAGDVTLLKQAMLHDPLVGAVCDPEEVWQMTDEMLVAQAEWLPQYAGAVPEAKRRLARAKRRGEYRGTWKWKGAARRPVRSVEELRRDKAARTRATEADKAAADRTRDARKGRRRRKKQ
jgi:alpha-galactosidase